MPRRRPPLWLAVPSRFAAMPKGRARGAAILLILLLIAGFTALGAPAVADDIAASDTSILYDGVAAGLGAGGDYYELTADALRAGGYPLSPFGMFRLPTHSVVRAALPDIAAIALLYLLVAGVAAAWWWRLRTVLAHPAARIAAMMLLVGGTLLLLRDGAGGTHGIWAAQLIALALALRRPGRWIEAAALTLMAMLVSQTAVVFAIVMALAAWRDGERREATGWAVVLLVFGIAMVAHAWAVAQVANPLDANALELRAPLGIGASVRSLVAATAVQPLPLTIAAPLVPLALFGWPAWRDPLGERALATCLVYSLAIAASTSSADAWTMPIAPILLVGLVFVADSLRDLAAALLDTPRVRVQRISR